MFIVCLVIESPGIHLHEVKQLLLEYTAINVQESTICKTLKEACARGLWLQRSELLRSQYILGVSIYEDYPELFVFVDEMGCDRRDRY